MARVLLSLAVLAVLAISVSAIRAPTPTGIDYNIDQYGKSCFSLLVQIKDGQEVFISGGKKASFEAEIGLVGNAGIYHFSQHTFDDGEAEKFLKSKNKGLADLSPEDKATFLTKRKSVISCAKVKHNEPVGKGIGLFDAASAEQFMETFGGESHWKQFTRDVAMVVDFTKSRDEKAKEMLVAVLATTHSKDEAKKVMEAIENNKRSPSDMIVSEKVTDNASQEETQVCGVDGCNEKPPGLRSNAKTGGKGKGKSVKK